MPAGAFRGVRSVCVARFDDLDLLSRHKFAVIGNESAFQTRVFLNCSSGARLDKLDPRFGSDAEWSRRARPETRKNVMLVSIPPSSLCAPGGI
jgi:hypothetical protein